MKWKIAVLFIAVLTFFGCSDENDKTCMAPAGYYKRTLALIKNECKMADTELEESIILIYKDDPVLKCGAHEYTSTVYRSCVDCEVITKLSVITTEKNISGQSIATHKCKKGSLGYYIAGGKTECTDIFDVYAEPTQ